VELVLDGRKIHSLYEFYDQVELNCTKDLDWDIGRNQNAVIDVLRGGFGLHEYGEAVTLRIAYYEAFKKNLGEEETLKAYDEWIPASHPSNRPMLVGERNAVKKGSGKLLYEILCETICLAENVNLVLD